MQEIDNSMMKGALTAVVAALGDQKEVLEHRDVNRPPRLELEELKAELDEDISNEIAYLRDAGIVSTEVLGDETVEVKLSPDLEDKASELKDLLYEDYGGYLGVLAASDEYMDFEPPDGWPRWEGPEQNDLAEGSVDYSKNIGPLCAVMSTYGEERLRGAEIVEYSVESMREQFSLKNLEVDLDIEEHLETLERLGYVERHSTRFDDVYRLADDEEVKTDAEMIAEQKKETFSGYPKNMAFAYEESDRTELAENGVKLVQRPEKQVK